MRRGGNPSSPCSDHADFAWLHIPVIDERAPSRGGGKTPYGKRLPSYRSATNTGGRPMLELRPNCECCDADLPPASDAARICTFEHTFCADCADIRFDAACPDCGGGLVARPIRP